MKVLELIVSVLTSLIKGAIIAAIIGFIAVIAIFILSIFMPDNVLRAVEIIKDFFH